MRYVFEHVCFISFFMLIEFLLCSLVELWNRLCVILILWYILDNLLLCHTLVRILGLFGVFSKLHLLLVLESLVHAYLLNLYHMACFTFFDPIYRVNSNKSICTYLCGVYPMYCSCLTTSDPISLGTTLCLIFVLGTMEIHWKLILFIMKVVWSSYNWRQAMVIGKLISTSSLQCYLGNKYLSHAYTYHPNLCRLYIMAWNPSLRI